MPVRPLSLKICIATFPWFRQNKQDSFLFLVLFSLPTTNFFIFPRNVLFFGKKILLAEKSFFRPLSFSFLVYAKQRRQDPSRAKNTYFSSIKIIQKTPFSIKNQRIEITRSVFPSKEKFSGKTVCFSFLQLRFFFDKPKKNPFSSSFRPFFLALWNQYLLFYTKINFCVVLFFTHLKYIFASFFHVKHCFFVFCFELFHMERKNDIFICALSCFCG